MVGKKSKKKKLEERHPLYKPFLISVFFHVICITIILASPPGWFFQPTPPMEFMWVELPKGVSEDVETVQEKKELPKETKQQLEALKPIPKPKKDAMPEPKDKKKTQEKKIVAKKPRKTSRMDSALAKIDKRLKQRDTGDVEKGTGGFEHGTSNKPQKDKAYQAALIKYRAQIRSRILRQWVPPSSANDQPTGNVSITVIISKGGDVMSTHWAKKSSNASLNESAMRAIRRASPFPIPPDPLKWEAFNEGFSVVFNPRTR